MDFTAFATENARAEFLNICPSCAGTPDAGESCILCGASTPEADGQFLCTECGHARQNAAQASACCTMQGSPCPDCVTDPRD